MKFRSILHGLSVIYRIRVRHFFYHKDLQLVIANEKVYYFPEKYRNLLKSNETKMINENTTINA